MESPRRRYALSPYNKGIKVYVLLHPETQLPVCPCCDEPLHDYAVCTSCKVLYQYSCMPTLDCSECQNNGEL